MRLAGIEKAGYYPTPEKSLFYLSQMIHAKAGSSYRLFDPCCGKGHALSAVAAPLRRVEQANITTYGVELSPDRAQESAEVLDHTFNDDAANIAISQGAFSLLWLNPPYDFAIEESDRDDGRRNRLEYTFLQKHIAQLQVGGLLVYIVPHNITQRPNVARFLVKNFQQLRCFRFPAGEYEAFNQVVVTGILTATEIYEDTPQRTEDFLALCKDPLTLSESSFDHVRLELPESILPTDKLTWRRKSLSYDDLATLARASGGHHTRDWRNFYNTNTATSFHPVVPLKTGHLGSLISSGQMGIINLGQLVADGRTVKARKAYNAQNGEVALDDPTAVKHVEKFETRINTVDRAGNHHVIDSIAEFEEFLSTHAQRITQVVQQKYAPLYTEPKPAEWAALAPLMPRKRLPGRAIAGMLDTQKHVAIASARSCRHQGWADIIGEMGTGKTATSLATIALMHSYPALILCPGHMVEKWKRETEEVIPGAKATIITDIGTLEKFVAYQRSHPSAKAIAIISKERAKLGSGWKPAHAWRKIPRKRYDECTHSTEQTKQVIGRYIATLPCCPSCGAIVTPDPKKRQFCEARVMRVQKGEYVSVVCNTPLFQFSGLHRWPVSDYINKKLHHFFKMFVADECHQYKGKATDQAEAYHQLIKACKYTLNLTGTLFGGKSVDLFWLRHRIDPAVRDDFAFNGETAWATKYGRLEHSLNKVSEEQDGTYSGKRRYTTRSQEVPGISPAVFSRILKSAIFVKVADLGFKMPTYDETIIRLPMDDVQSDQYDWLHGTLLKRIQDGMKSFDSIGRKEATALLGVWLQNSLSRPNSGFRTEEIWWNYPWDEDGELLDKPSKRPYFVPIDSAPFTPEPLIGDELETVGLTADDDDDRATRNPSNLDRFTIPPRTEPMILRPVVVGAELLPKEQWLTDYIQHERKSGRKVLIYVRQTGTRNIQPRIERILKRAGIRAVTLPDSVKPAKREQWIANHVDAIDALITNPKKVETGLDLIQFSTCIFYELDYSLFTLWQAMRRVWRLGQTKPVKVLFPVYKGTLEESALTLMGEKMKAAMLLYGDNAASAIADEASASAGDFMAELAHRILNGADLQSDGLSGLMHCMVGTPTESLESLGLPEELAATTPQTALDTTVLDTTVLEIPRPLTPSMQTAIEQLVTASMDSAQRRITALDTAPAEATIKNWWQIQQNQSARNVMKAKPKAKPQPNCAIAPSLFDLVEAVHQPTLFGD